MTAKKKTKPKKKKTIVAVSGGFDPIHIGHIRMIQEAARMGDYLVVIVNNDNWLVKKKGYAFMPETERVEIVRAIEGVDDVFLTLHEPDTKDRSVCRELEIIRPHIFANGGDRTNDNIPEVPLCEKIGCEMIFNVGHGGKAQSSSWLLDRFATHTKTKSRKGKAKK